jgi:RimJ/RimL family protein N-acetyltransferase
MILSGKNIELRLLDESMLETLRLWRNQENINQFMEYQKMISKEAQKKWYQQLSKKHNYYFIIHLDVKAVGMIHLTKIENNQAESGMFIAENEFQGTGISFNASLLVLDFAFDALGLHIIYAKVKNDNVVAQNYNKLLGFKLEKPLSDSFSNWILKRDDYLIQREIIKKLID